MNKQVNALMALVVMDLADAAQIEDDYDDTLMPSGNEVQKEKQNKTEIIARAIGRLQKAYELEDKNPNVLNHLANHYFIRNDYKMAFDLARKSSGALKKKGKYRKGVYKSIEAECFYNLGTMSAFGSS